MSIEARNRRLAHRGPTTVVPPNAAAAALPPGGFETRKNLRESSPQLPDNDAASSPISTG